MVLSQPYLSMVDLESRSGQDAGLDVAQSLADLVHGLVHYHDGGPSTSFQPAMLAIGAAQHAVYQPPATSANTHSLVASSPCNVSKCSFTCCVCVIRSINPLQRQLALIHLLCRCHVVYAPSTSTHLLVVYVSADVSSPCNVS